MRRFATENVGEVHDWLAARGVTWPELFADPSGGALPRIHVVAGGGPGLVVALAEAAGPDVVVFDAEGTGLVRDACGQVVGVDWRDGATGGAHTTLAGAVVVATGGFMRNLDSVREVRPDLGERELRWGSWPGADGNGLAWLVAEGAATENLGAVGFYAHGAPAPEVEGWPEMGVSFAALVPWVDGRGARFVDESTTQSFRTGTLRAGMDAAWILFDQPAADVGIFESGEGGTPRYTFGEVLDGGRVVRGGTLEEVAEGIGADPATLVGEVDAFDAYARGEGTDRLRSGSPAVPVAVPPYYALPLAITVAKGFGGVSVDVDGAVLGTDGAAVPGLYAAGELTGMAGGTLVGDAGFTGSLSAVVLSGRVAGASAVAAAVSRASGGS